MRVLHILRSADDERALAMATAHARDHETALILLNGAVDAELGDFPGAVYACLDSAGPASHSTGRTIVGYDEVVRLIFAHDRVVVW